MHRVHAVVAAALIAALAPTSAYASTWTVDDDKADCPNAAFTSIQAAIDQAAPWDTVVVCAGEYAEQSTPTSGNSTPSQAGSRNGLTITKPLTIKGAGADKVFIRPALGPSLAGTAPYLRDGGGNVVTVSRQSLGSSDDNENFVDISGVTIESPDSYAEAGLAFFNTSGRFANSRIGTIKADGGPYTYGVIMTNSLQGAEAGVRREVILDGSLITGDVLFDDARGADGSATTTARSGIKAYGTVNRSRITGTLTYTYGQRGSITASEIAGPVILTDAETGQDPSNPVVRAFSASGSSLLGGLTNTGATAALVTGNFWGSSTTTGPVEREPALSEPPAPLSVPAPTADAPPTGAIVDPYGPTTVAWDETIHPVVVAADDFGVKSVELTANGQPVGTLGRTPYEFTYRPAPEHIGEHVVLTAKITDSSDQSTIVSTELDVPAVTTTTTTDVSGTVPATLALSVDAPATFGAFTPGVTQDYVAATTVTVLSTAGDAALSVVDPSTSAPGHLVNGAFVLPQPLQARALNALNTGSPFGTVSDTSLTLLSYGAPVSHDPVTLEFKQPITATDALRTGVYAKALTYTLSTNNP
jgi:hypothetical protein